MQATVDITIDVTDCNDNKPCFVLPSTYTARCEGDPADSVAASFAVVDSDLSPPNNVFTVEIVTGTNGPLMGGVAPFKLVGVSGVGHGSCSSFCTQHNALLHCEMKLQLWNIPSVYSSLPTHEACSLGSGEGVDRILFGIVL